MVIEEERAKQIAGSKQVPLETVEELLRKAYGTLGVYIAFVRKKSAEVNPAKRAKLRPHFGIRYNFLTRNFKVRDFETNEKLKMAVGKTCHYCGRDGDIEKPWVEHVISKTWDWKLKGSANVINACPDCQREKHAKDFMEWQNQKDKFPPLLIMELYLKLLLSYCEEKELMDKTMEEAREMWRKNEIPFNVDDIPHSSTIYKKQGDLKLEP